ncbi:MAG: metal ABC transporter permease [Oscillospiraceae bacterium]|jgi:manganese/zinc/iron transport system permease protein|nr:metal ABC transporter permease [Oscillospiraceae bacterium]
MVFLGLSLIGLLCGSLGSVLVLKKQSLIGDGVSHSSLAGVTAAFLFFNSSQTAMLLGAFAAAMVAFFIINLAKKVTTFSFETIMAVVMSGMFGLGLCFMAAAQNAGGEHLQKLEEFVVGQENATLDVPIIPIAVCTCAVALLILLCFDYIKISAFDAYSAGLAKGGGAFADFALFVLTIAAITLCLQTVGVVLMSALLIAPAVTARRFAKGFGQMVVLSACVGAVTTAAAYGMVCLLPFLPAGPVIALLACVPALLAVIK